MQVLGLGIIAGASIVKVPQILALTASKSAEGLSKLSFELENIGYTIHAGYGFILGLPFSTYGEAGIMLLQNVVLLGLVYKYARVKATRALSVAVLNIAIITAIVAGARMHLAHDSFVLLTQFVHWHTVRTSLLESSCCPSP